MSDRWLDKALELTDELESARARVSKLEATLQSFIKAGADPMLILRAEASEMLLKRIIAEPQAREALPPNLRTQIEAQLVAVEIFRRDDL